MNKVDFRFINLEIKFPKRGTALVFDATMRQAPELPTVAQDNATAKRNCEYITFLDTLSRDLAMCSGSLAQISGNRCFLISEKRLFTL